MTNDIFDDMDPETEKGRDIGPPVPPEPPMIDIIKTIDVVKGLFDHDD